jgi:hypothetical protein
MRLLTLLTVLVVAVTMTQSQQLCFSKGVNDVAVALIMAASAVVGTTERYAVMVSIALHADATRVMMTGTLWSIV